MKRISAPIRIIATAALALVGHSAAQTAITMRSADFGFYPFSKEDFATFSADMPGSFPNPSTTVYGHVDCSASPIRSMGAKEDQPAFDQLLKSPGVTVGEKTISLDGVTIGCVNGKPNITAGSFDRLLKLFPKVSEWDYSAVRADKEKKRLAFNLLTRCTYEAIHEDCWSWNLYIDLSGNTAAVTSEWNGVKGLDIVGFQQGGKLQPVYFDSKSTPVKFDPNKPFTLWVKAPLSKFWQAMEINYAKGSMSWWRSDNPPQ